MPQDFSYNTCPIEVLLKVVEWIASCEVTVYVSFPHNVIDKIVAGHSMRRGKVCLSRKLPPTISSPHMVLPLLLKLFVPSHSQVGEVLGVDIPPWEGLYEMFSCFNPLQSSDIPH